MLFIEVAIGLELLEIENAGTIKVPNLFYGIKVDKKKKLTNFLGYNIRQLCTI